MEEKKKQKRTKNHIRLVLDKIFYGRYVPNSKIANKETATAKKIVNILIMYTIVRDLGYKELRADYFCEDTGISKSSYRRNVAIVKKLLGICDGVGNTFEDTPANRRYLTILTLYKDLCSYKHGVNMQEFCVKNGISRSTFFRYLNYIENYLCNMPYGYKQIALGEEDGHYYIVDPDD